LDILKKILCPINFSDRSEKTVSYALEFAAKFGIKPHILHVTTKPPEVYYRFFPDITGYLNVLERDTQMQLNNFIQKIDPELKATIRYGAVYQEIIQFAQDEAFDLIIINGNEYSSTVRRFPEVIPQKIIRKAECPVLTIYGDRSKAEIKKILCPLDLSPRSYRGLAHAVSLARKFNAQVLLLHVVELHEFDNYDLKAYSSEEAFTKFCELFKKEIKIPAEIQDVKIEKVIRRNIDAAAEIIYFAEEESIDLITLTTHGRSYWPRVLLGSVTEKVTQIAPCPVLTIRS